ncbi:MAG: hypothetical protein LC789_01840 [Actinobacteria bacterium]|nr:hypothetical protein [Actinomycetota bacterium]MCA1721185.1 hypothetical protein [Actinomycetota bacterium]
MSLQDDVAAARRAVVDLEQATASVSQHFQDTVDVRRLKADVERLSADLDLLCGAPPSTRTEPLEIIPDIEYAHDFWMDAEDEGLGYPHKP